MRRFLSAASLALSLPPQLPAQGAVPETLRSIRPGETLRLSTADGRHIEGRFATLGFTPTGLSLREHPQPVPLTLIDSLWVRSSATRTGAIIGTLAFGIPAAVLSSWACTTIGDGTCRGWYLIPGMTLTGASIGFALGAGLGSGRVRWHLRYVRPPSRGEG